MTKSKRSVAVTAFESTVVEVRQQREKLMPPKLLQINEGLLHTMRNRFNAEIKAFWQTAKDLQEVASKPDVYGHEAARLLAGQYFIGKAEVEYCLAAAEQLSDEFISQIIEYNLSDDSRYCLVQVGHVRLIAAANTRQERDELWACIRDGKWSVQDAKAATKANKDATRKARADVRVPLAVDG